MKLNKMNISIVNAGDFTMVKRLRYKFTGSMRVADVLMEDGTPFGTVKNGELEFQFPVCVGVRISSSLNSPGFELIMAIYRATLSSRDGEIICVLERIFEITPEHESLIQKQIKMEGDKPLGSYGGNFLQLFKEVIGKNLVVDVNIVDNEGRTALDYARQKKHNDIIELLLHSGAEEGKSIMQIK